MNIKLIITCDIKHPENSLQDVSQPGPRILPLDLDDAWPDADSKHFCKFICGCIYRTVNYYQYYFHKRIAVCSFEHTAYPQVIRGNLV